MNALVVLSGGQDSTTCLFLAKQQHEHVRALTINYGQRHAKELAAAEKVAEIAGVPLEMVDVPDVMAGNSPLVNDSTEVEHYLSVAALPSGIEATFVPGRNLLFLSIAANRAAFWNCDTIVIGVSQEDYGGYPDCRAPFIAAMGEAISLGVTGHRNKLLLAAPLLNMTKKETVQRAKGLPGCMEALAYSHTCYDGEYPPNPNNHASLLRAKGFEAAATPDPLIMRAIEEGKLPKDYSPYGLPPEPKKDKKVERIGDDPSVEFGEDRHD